MSSYLVLSRGAWLGKLMRTGQVILLSILSAVSAHASYIFSLYSAQYMASYTAREMGVVAGIEEALYLSGRGAGTYVYWIVVRRVDGTLKRYLCSNRDMSVNDQVEFSSSVDGYVTTDACSNPGNKIRVFWGGNWWRGT